MEEDKDKIRNEINKILELTLNNLITNYFSLRNTYNVPYKMPELDPIRGEITLCLLHGFNQAAIMLTNHLLETFLKVSLIYYHSRQRNDKTKPKVDIAALINNFKEEVDEYMGKDLYDTINRACSVGLITKVQKNRLHKIREDLRNAFSHGDKKILFNDISIPTQMATIENDEILFSDENLQQLLYLPFAHGIAQVKFAEKNALPYFQYIDSLIRDSLPKVMLSMQPNEIK